jgi:hypothetical protein
MKQMTLALLMSLFSVMTAIALPFSEARREAWYLTDKMAYELNLTPEQYDYVYQVNFDYLLHINTPYDCRGRYWDYRNIDLYYILHDWQYNLYKVATHFYTPIQWRNNAWNFLVYKLYQHDKHYFSKPVCYHSYHGGNWKNRKAHSQSAYRHHSFKHGTGMRDNYHKGQSTHSVPKPIGKRSNISTEKQRPSVDRSRDKTRSTAPSSSRPLGKVQPTARPKTQTRPASQGNGKKRDFGR